MFGPDRARAARARRDRRARAARHRRTTMELRLQLHRRRACGVAPAHRFRAEYVGTCGGTVIARTRARARSGSAADARAAAARTPLTRHTHCRTAGSE